MIDIKCDEKREPTIQELLEEIKELENTTAVKLAVHAGGIRTELLERRAKLRKLYDEGKRLERMGFTREYLLQLGFEMSY